MRRFEMWFGLCTALASGGFFLLIIPKFIEPSDFTQVSPALLPQVATVLIGILGFLLFLSRLASKEGDDVPLPFKEGDDVPLPFTAKELGHLAIVVLIFTVGALLILKAGFMIGGVLLVAALMFYLKARNWLVIVLVSVITPAALIGIFEVLVGSHLP